MSKKAGNRHDSDRGCKQCRHACKAKPVTWTSRAVGGACWRISCKATHKLSAQLFTSVCMKDGLSDKYTV